jgi:K+-transporting ATPase KdpF subunit
MALAIFATSLCRRPAFRIETQRRPVAPWTHPKEAPDAGYRVLRAWPRADGPHGGLCRRAEEIAMFEAILGLVVALALGVYLIITLIAPEKF